ncbi:MAG: hypothetical protein KF767_13490 [Bdellovibrionaceae bacterium]|nr:hypothetical protein [Pseudobdellovibrionaceae bacterium]
MRLYGLLFIMLSSPLTLWAQHGAANSAGAAWATDSRREKAATTTNSNTNSRSRNSSQIRSSGHTSGFRSNTTPQPRRAADPAVANAEVGSSRPLLPGESHLALPLTNTELAPERPYRASWSLSLGGQFIRDSLANQKTQAALGLNLGLDYNFTEMFALNVQPRVSFRNGHVQAASATNGRENSLELLNAAAVFSDRNYFALTAGALDMTQTHSTLLVASTFPAAKAMLSTGETRALSLSLSAMAAVPSSATLTNNSQDYDKTPSFSSAALRVRYQGERFEALAQVATFQFRDLPLNVSTDSTYLGNTPLGADNSPQNEFRYRFQGQEARLGAGVQISRRLNYRFQGAVIRNAEAPEGLSTGYLLGNQIEFVMNGNWTLAPSFSYFRVEPDATIANYNDAMTTTNRIGYATGMSFHYKKMFKVGALGGEREVVYLKTSQARERFMNLTLETFDVPF